MKLVASEKRQSTTSRRKEKTAPVVHPSHTRLSSSALYAPNAQNTKTAPRTRARTRDGEGRGGPGLAAARGPARGGAEEGRPRRARRAPPANVQIKKAAWTTAIGTSLACAGARVRRDPRVRRGRAGPGRAGRGRAEPRRGAEHEEGFFSPRVVPGPGLLGEDERMERVQGVTGTHCTSQYYIIINLHSRPARRVRRLPLPPPSLPLRSAFVRPFGPDARSAEKRGAGTACHAPTCGRWCRRCCRSCRSRR